MPEKQEVLLADKLCSGDRPSAYVAGMVVAHSLRKAKMAVLMVNVLGQVIAMPPDAVTVNRHPLLQDIELDSMEEGDAIRVMAAEGREDAEIVEYLKRRKTNGSTNEE